MWRRVLAWFKAGVYITLTREHRARLIREVEDQSWGR